MSISTYFTKGFKYICCVVLACVSLSTFAQPGLDANNKPIVPISPNAASIAKVGNVPVGMYTGQPNVSFPLYTIDNGAVKVPINLSYNYNGLKVEEYPSWVGTGWTLNSTGVINRQTRGLPDESDGGYNGLYKKGLEVYNYSSSGATINTPDFKTLLEGIRDGINDSEIDVFTFSMPGHSGKFYFDHTQCNSQTKTGIVIPFQNITVKGYFNYSYRYYKIHGEIEKFELTDESGTIYTFNVKERSGQAREDDIDGGSGNLDFENTWYLSSIKDVHNNTVTYHYKATQRRVAMPPTVSESMLITDAFRDNLANIDVMGSFGKATPQFQQSDNWEVILESIHFRNAKVDFIEEQTDRNDWDMQTWPGFVDRGQEKPKALDKIVVTVNDEVIKEIDFHYSYFGDNARLRLDDFQEKNNGQTLPSTRFTYHEKGAFPKIGTNAIFSQDHWGYYTGVPNSSLLPTVAMRIKDASLTLPGNSRQPNHAATRLGILTEIEYPTGGTTAFEYEPNTFNQSFGDISLPSSYFGLELSSLGSTSVSKANNSQHTLENRFTFNRNSEGLAKIKSFMLKSGKCIDNAASVWLKNTDTGEMIFNHTLTYTSSGIVPSHFGPMEEEEFILPSGHYELVAWYESPSCVTDNEKKAFVELMATPDSGSPGTPSPNRNAGGMRVKEVRSCAYAKVSGCFSKFYKYTDFNNAALSSGVLSTAPIYSYDLTYEWKFVNPLTGVASYANLLATMITSSSQVSLLGTQGNSVGYEYVTVLESEDGSKGKSLYKFTTAREYSDGTSTAFPFPPTEDMDHLRRFQKKEQHFTPDTKLRETTIEPTTLQKAQAYSIKFADKYYRGSDGLTNYLDKYHFIKYRIGSSLPMQPAWQVSTSYENGKLLKDSTSFTYSYLHLQLTEKRTVTSKGEELVTTYLYKDDIIADPAKLTNPQPGDLSGVQASPYITAVVEQKEFKNATLTTTKRTLYNGNNPSRILSGIGVAPLTEEVKYTDFDNDGNILSLATRSGDVYSYLYGYNNTLPKAYAVNAKVQDIYYTSFEDGEEGTIHSEAKAGTKVLNTNTFTFPLTFVPTNVSSTKMSYWYWSGGTWNYSGVVNYSTSFTIPGATMIDEVRAFPAGARMNTFTYKPGVGMNSRTDENNMTQYFEFDELGRLKTTYNNDKKVVNGFEYFYKKTN